MKESTRKVFDYLRNNNGTEMTADSIADALGISKRSVVGSFNSFQKKGWGVREETEIELADGTHQKIKILRMTDEGMAADPDATSLEKMLLSSDKD